MPAGFESSGCLALKPDTMSRSDDVESGDRVSAFPDRPGEANPGSAGGALTD